MTTPNQISCPGAATSSPRAPLLAGLSCPQSEIELVLLVVLSESEQLELVGSGSRSMAGVQQVYE